MAKMHDGGLPAWAEGDLEILTMCRYDETFRARVLGTPPRDAEIMRKSARARIARLRLPLVRPSVPRVNDERYCRRCRARRPAALFTPEVPHTCGPCVALGASSRGSLESRRILELTGLQRDEVRTLDGERWRVAGAAYHGGHWGMPATRIMMVRVSDSAIRQMDLKDVFAAARAEVSNAAE